MEFYNLQNASYILKLFVSCSIYIYIIYVYIGEGNGTPPQYSCLENPMDRGVW